MHEGLRTSPPTCVRHARSNPCETDGGRCEHRPPASVLVRLRYQPCPSCVHTTLLPVPGKSSEAARETIARIIDRAFVSHGDLVRKQCEPALNMSLLKRYTRAEHRCDMAANSGKTQTSGTPTRRACGGPRTRILTREPEAWVLTEFDIFRYRSAGTHAGLPRASQVPRPRVADPKTAKGRPRGRPFRQLLDARSIPPRRAPRHRSRSRHRARRSAPPTRSPR